TGAQVALDRGQPLAVTGLVRQAEGFQQPVPDQLHGAGERFGAGEVVRDQVDPDGTHRGRVEGLPEQYVDQPLGVAVEMSFHFGSGHRHVAGAKHDLRPDRCELPLTGPAHLVGHLISSECRRVPAGHAWGASTVLLAWGRLVEGYDRSTREVEREDPVLVTVIKKSPLEKRPGEIPRTSSRDFS